MRIFRFIYNIIYLRSWYNYYNFTVGKVSLSKLWEMSKKHPRFPEESEMCEQCHYKAVIRMDGFDTCLFCGDVNVLDKPSEDEKENDR